MNKNFILGQYVKGDSFLHKADPRVKIISSIILMVAIFFLKQTYFMLGYLALLTIIVLISRISVIKVLQGFKPLVFLSLFIFFFQIFFNKEGEVLYSVPINFSITSIIALVLLTIIFIIVSRYIRFKALMFVLYLALIVVSLMYLTYPDVLKSYSINLYEKGVKTAIYVFFRMIALVYTATLLTLTTKPTDLTLALEWLFKPLKIFKINSEEIALIITIALRYIPTILIEANKIMDAQASRGADYKSGNIFKKIKQLVSLLVPMFVISFERSDQLSDAMTARNFVPGKPKTKYHHLKWRGADTLLLILTVILLGGSICLYIFL